MGFSFKRTTPARTAVETGEPPRATSGVPLALVVPRQIVDSPEIIMKGATQTPAAESFRRLRMLLENDDNGRAQVIVVTSPAPREGKSLVAINLALAFVADKKKSVLLVDADLRRPTLDKRITPEPSLGLSDLLAAQVELDHVVLHVKDSLLSLLPAGAPVRDPAMLLASDRCREQILLMRERYDRIIIDTAPLMLFTDANAVGKFGDGILLVARCGQTPQSGFNQTVGMVTSSRILGVVLNDAIPGLSSRQRYYERQYHLYYGKDRKR